MASAIEALGMSLANSSAQEAVSEQKVNDCHRAGNAVMNLIREDIRPLDIMTRKAFENSISVVIALGGSTNAVLHLLAIACEAGVTLSLDDFTEAQRAWLTGSFAKVCCRVNSEDELMEVHDKALEAGLEVHLITDSGKTEFHGEPTNTCLAIGPDDAEKIDAITGQLQLL